ncbi:hypothetical protein B0A49_08998 [Cryomyces minteri]|uniref:Redoxin domain-containing protein n=1 Tax=Cryomyces minteri TaxID=331657 RepID=A0A4U0WEW6_9PEZI|nr:hypothetical protein B0A49_08998 [Cryomyces minteri]
MFASRRLSATVPRALGSFPRSSFHSTSRAFVKIGDGVPDVELMENSPGNKVNLAKELKGKGLVIGVPAAFKSHIPGYINSKAAKDAGPIFVVSVNDAFVMKAWAQDLDPSGSSGIRFLADPTLAFTNALDLSFDGANAIFGGPRSKRYTLVIEDGKVKEAHVEPDNTGVNVSAADKVLAGLEGK